MIFSIFMFDLTNDRKLKENRHFKLKSYIHTKIRYFFIVQKLLYNLKKYKYYKLIINCHLIIR